MFLSHITYIRKSNRQTIIKHREQKIIIDKVINEVLNDLCLTNLSTLKGRVDAVRCLLHLRKFIPVYVNEELILIPVYNSRYWDQIFVNFFMIDNIIKVGENTSRINFYDNSTLTVELSYLRLKRLIEKCLKIRETFIYERGKY